MKIATMATGGIGGFLASRLTDSGHQVAAIARGKHLEAIRDEGLRLETPDGVTTVQPWKCASDPAEVGLVDAVIFAVKGDDLETAAKACIPMLAPQTVVVPFLNGVEAAERLLAILPPENVANGVAYISTTVAAPGIIRQTGQFNRFAFAECDNRPSTRIEALRAAINEAGSSAPPIDDIDAEIWKKFIFFSAASGITAAARCTMKDILASEPLADVFRTAIAETASVARALGVDLADTVEEDAWTTVINLPPTMRASTAIDLEKGHPLEIEWLSGSVLRLASKAAVNVPVTKTLYGLLHPYRDGKPDKSQ